MRSPSDKQNPFVFYLLMFLDMFLMLLLRLVALSPVVCFFGFPANSSFRWLALLAIPLLLLLVLPIRFSFAEALVQDNRERRFSIRRSFSFSQYGIKVAEGLRHGVKVLLWGIPTLALIGFLFYMYKTGTDAFSLLKGIGDVGETVMSVLRSVHSFFRGIFGGEELVFTESKTLYGIYGILFVLAMCILIWLFGGVRNSAYRYIWVKAMSANRNPVTEERRSLRGRRWAQFGTGLLNLLLFVPFFAVVAIQFKPVASKLSSGLLTFMMSKDFSSLELDRTILPIAIAFVCLYMTLLPVRRWLTCSFATKTRRHTVPGK